MKTITKTNPNRTKLIVELQKHSASQKSSFWKRISIELQKPTRRTREVNLYKLSKHTKENEIILVPGKVLGNGKLDHNIKVAAFSYTESAKEKLKGNIISIEELLKKDPQGKKIRIIG